MPAALNSQQFLLSSTLAPAVAGAEHDWNARQGSRRLWASDASLWTDGDEARWLGWLTIVHDEQARVGELTAFADEVAADGITDVLLLGMGGSSLAPDVVSRTFGRQARRPALHVLDSTDPSQIRRFESTLEPARALVVVASKSGGTLEPNILLAYFLDRVRASLGGDAGRHFIAITDPGSQMQTIAEREGMRRVFFGVPQIGGRFSALSRFGLVPAALAGVDVGRFLASAGAMVEACGPDRPVSSNPGVALGLLLGTMANEGRDKLTIVTSPGLASLGGWLEQLVAESTGKHGRAIVPVDGEPLLATDAYGADRVFAVLRLDGEAVDEPAVEAVARAGHPVVRIDVRQRYALAQEFFRWEVATAVAGAVMGIHPFDQPDVEASKVATRALTAEIERSGHLPAETPLFSDGVLTFYADAANAAALGTPSSAGDLLRAHFARLHSGDYVALLAYLDMNDANVAAFQRLRGRVGRGGAHASCVGFGPRFLHSTGQAYKGGPNTGVFLQVTCDDSANDVLVPGRGYSFGLVKNAQARGDFQVLSERGRRALRVDLGADVSRGLAALETAMERA